MDVENGRRSEQVVREIEQAFVSHWCLIGRWPGARLHDEDGVLRFETPVRKLPYNGVIRTEIAGPPDRVVRKVVDSHHARDAQFFWLVHPSARPSDLSASLARAGLAPVEAAVGMSLDLGDWQPAAPTREDDTVAIVEVVDEAGLRAYEDVVMAYWELDEADREHVVRLNRHWSGARAHGHRWVALDGGVPIGKAYLSLAGPPGVAAIYGMSVRPEARGKGLAGRASVRPRARTRAARR